MNKKKKFEKHVIKPDHVYNSVFIQRFINCVMKDGNKSTAEKNVYKTLSLIEKKIKKPSLEIIETAIKNVSPKIRLVSITYYAGRKILFPVPVTTERAEWQALKWIIDDAIQRRKSEIFNQKDIFAHALASAIKDAYLNTGYALKKKKELYKHAESNRTGGGFF